MGIVPLGGKFTSVGLDWRVSRRICVLIRLLGGTQACQARKDLYG